MRLSDRLETISALVTPGCTVADIGTDHAYIPIKLVAEGIIPSALAMDIKEGPLSRAEEHIVQAGLGEKIKTRLSDGMDKLKPWEVDSIIIAGMGGDLLIKILDEWTDNKNTIKEYILSPHTEWKKVRKYLRTHGYMIVDEDIVNEEDKYYIVLKAVPSDNYTNKESTVYDMFGELLIKNNNPVLKQYLIREYNKYTKILTNLSLHADGENSIIRIDEIKEYLMHIQEAEHEMQ